MNAPDYSSGLSLGERQSLFPTPDPSLEASAATAAALVDVRRKVDIVMAHVAAIASVLIEEVECEII